jgi:DNA repair exonuclease SbcCD ATPase subunit
VSRVPLAFRTLGVRRMPGITDGGWELAELSPGVNIVWGPNGAGKTTSAAALEHLLWPGATRGARPLAAALVTLGGDEWRVEVDGATARYQRNGDDAPGFPPLPPPTERDRYRLSLHELLSETDRPLAELILHESAGGFNVAGAADALGFRRTAGRATREREALDHARARLAELRDEEARLREDEARLGEIRREEAEHRAGAARRPVLERALERMDATDAERDACEAVERFPAALATLRGDEAERLRDLREALAGVHDRQRAALREADDARRSLADADRPFPGDLLPHLAAAQTQLQQLEETARRLDRELARAREECRAEQAAVAGAVGDDHVAALTLPAVEELLAFARVAEQHRAEVRAADAELAWLASDAPGADPDALRRGRDLLAGWLREPADDRVRTLALAGAGLAAVAGAALGWAVHPAAYLLVAVAAVLGFLAWSARREAGGRERKEREYERTGLDRPARWAPGEVADLVDRLESRIAEARHQAQRAERAAAARRRRAELDAAAAEIGRERAQLASRIGLAPDADEGAVAWLCQRVHRWQVARGAVGQKEAELRAAREQHADAARMLERWLAPFAGVRVESAAELAGKLEELRGREQAESEARLRLHAAGARYTEAAADAERTLAECASLLQRAGLPPDGDRRMEELCAIRHAFAASRDALTGAEQVSRSAERRLAEAGADDATRALPRAAVEAALEASRAAEAEAARCNDEALTLEERIRAARARTEIEDALARVRDAASVLRESRERDEAATAGWVLREFVERETRDRDRPAVFHRARDLFTAITRGRYRLDLSDTTPPEFRATDTATGAGCGLDELSRGTRVQLLLAVRIAFIETLEEGVRLPLVLDEALANSDDRRAEAVMDAAIELARDGRQLFFLTARIDEAERWMARLGGAGVPHALVDLAEARRIGRFTGLPRPSPRIGAVPAPGGLDHAAYGAELRVPPIDLDGPGSVHLWYLADDPALLHRLLGLGAETWGGLRAMVDAVGTVFLGPDESGYPRIHALGGAMERLLELRRVGRGRRVDREALERSGAITPVFIERVEALRHECGGRADLLLAGISELPRFRADARAALRDFLERDGYIDPRDPLDDSRIRTDLLVAVAPDLRAGHCTPADIERLLAMVPVG